MTPDVINGLFEFVGSVLVWMNAYRVYTDRGYAGIYPPTVVMFWLWGLWNLFYYPHLGQWWSFAGGCSIVAANTIWFILMRQYGRRT